jgi:hypothetical protein
LRCEDSSQFAPTGITNRPLLKSVKLLLPVWGHRYVSQFLEFGLPTLMAAGNVPALAKDLPCEFEILTSSEDEWSIRHHPRFHALAGICRVTFHHIDHLITVGNNSTTLTLAYTEAVRASGAGMLDTCFFFLVSDYIVANGSLANVFDRIRAGASAVLAGNFQVVAEDATPWVRDRIMPDAACAALPARELMRWALDHLHPATLANVVNSSLSHNIHTNRLFWRVDHDTLIGRFFLMHMIAIRPEVTDFKVGASCDYSFVPEMCPSGNVSVMADSDDFLVIEMQPRGHESAFLRPGPLKVSALARSLNEWTTAQHRQNIRGSIVYHAAEQPRAVAVMLDAADAYVEQVMQRLVAKPQPHYGHPYWVGAIAAFREATRSRMSDEKFYQLLGQRVTAGFWIERLRALFFGLPGRVWPWHPRWPDFRPALRWLAPFLADPTQQVLLVSDAPTFLSVMVAEIGERAVYFRTSVLLQTAPEVHQPLVGRFAACLAEFDQRDVNTIAKAVGRIAPLMQDRGKIIIAIREQRPMTGAGEFGAALVDMIRQLTSSSVIVEEIRYVPAIRARWPSYRIFARLGTAAHQRPWFGIPVLAIVAGPLAIFTLILNLVAAVRTRTTRRRGMASSMYVMMQTVDAK